MNLSASGQAHKAKELIRQALPRAYHEGYQRLFIDYGEPAKSILRSASADVNDKNLFVYLRSVLEAFTTEPKSLAPGGAETALTRLFSAQEQRILRLLEAGLTRQEIAQELVISNNTLKTHLRHIYQKLNVTSRSEAIEAARRLLMR
jgi:LuxR family maltose regulon positive regulatory protein